MARRTPFNLTAEIARAWDYCWANRYEPERTPYLSATDLERRVRAAADERARNAPEGTGDGWMSSVRITGLGGRSLLDHVRDWLCGEVRRGRLTTDAAGRGHISGARYRPRGVGLSAAEEKAAAVPVEEKRRRRWITHLKSVWAGVPYLPPFSPAACRANHTRKGGWRYYAGRDRVHTTEDPAKVTCKVCRKIAEKRAAAVFAAAAEAGFSEVGEGCPVGVAGDWLEDRGLPRPVGV